MLQLDSIQEKERILNVSNSACGSEVEDALFIQVQTSNEPQYKTYVQVKMPVTNIQTYKH